jgi:malonyl CoA-acyl carrier protein transacylase
VSYLIWRRELQIYFRALAPAEARVLAASRAGQSFGELCVLLCEHLDESEASLQAAGFLRGWVESGLIVT